jgi:ABC-type lipoprotein export system ATPase subunit
LFIIEKTNFYIDREELNDLINFIDNKPLSENIKFNQITPETPLAIPKAKYLILTGTEGSGKATLLTQLCNKLELNENINLFYHFFNASIDCLSNESLAQRFVKQISTQLSKFKRFF